MAPVARWTRRRSEEALLRRYRELKKARTCPDPSSDDNVVEIPPPPPTLASSRSSSSASAPVPAFPSRSPVFRRVKEELEEEEDVARSGCYDRREFDDEEDDDDDVTEFVPEKQASSPILLDSSSPESSAEDMSISSEDSDFDPEEKEEEEDEISKSSGEEEEQGGKKMYSVSVESGSRPKKTSFSKKQGSPGSIDFPIIVGGDVPKRFDQKKHILEVKIENDTKKGDKNLMMQPKNIRERKKGTLSVAKEHVELREAEGTRSGSSDVESGIKMESKSPEKEEIENMYKIAEDYLCNGDQDAAEDCLDVEEEDDDVEDVEEDADEEEIENGGGRVDLKRDGRKVMMKPLTREKKRPLTADEIHRALINSIVDETSTIVAEEPVKKPHEIVDTRSSSNSSGVDSDGEMDTKNPQQEELDSIYRIMDFYLVNSDNNYAAAASCLEDEDNFKNPQQLCKEGKHYLILDEEIGVICKICGHVREEIKYVTAPFHANIFGVSDDGRYYMYDYQDPKNLPYFEDPNIDSKHSKDDAEFDPTGTVWEIIPDIRKTLFPHQREAFEFIWRNVGGGTELKELMSNKMSDGGGCLISHDPGTGKTRLAIAFLETHMKFYKNSRPVILAPASILLTWKKEFEKWKVEVPFVNLNDKELSENELSIAGSLFGRNYEKNLTNMAKRLIKLLFWKKHESVLAISYTLFTQLAGGEDLKNRGRKKKDGSTSRPRLSAQQEKLRELLLEMPGLLILDEGHMPRNERSHMFDVLSGVKTKKRVLLSGTPFQNNFRELHNVLGLVRKEFTEENPFKSNRNVDRADEGKIREFKEKIKPFCHRYDNYIISATVPGLVDNVVYLQPSELQNRLLKIEEESKNKKNYLESNVNMTLISVHPLLLHCKDLLLHCKDNCPDFTQELKSGSWNIDDGAKTRFLIRLIELSSALEEKVLVFSQYLYPLNFVKALLMSKDHFGWREGVEIQVMSGNQEMETRQRTMEYFNKPGSKAKVMLASTKACSEGIELTGASRVVLLDVTWNPSVERQAISRAYRMGQKKVVHVYHLIMTDNDSNRHCSQTKKNNFSNYMFPSNNKKFNDVPGSSMPLDCEDLILERLLDEKIIKEAIQERASDHHPPGPSNGF